MRFVTTSDFLMSSEAMSGEDDWERRYDLQLVTHTV